MPRQSVVVALLLAATALVYAPTWTYGFVYEDMNAAIQNPAVLGHVPIDLTRARWLSEVTHRLNYLMTGDRPGPFHATNVGLHLVNGVLVYQIGLVIAAPETAVLAMGIFLLHPIQTEAVAYVSSRSELLSTLFALWAFLLSLTTGVGWRGIARWVSIGVLITAAVCAKESAAVVVPLIAMAAYFRGRRVSWLTVGALLVPVAVMAVSVILKDYTSKAEMGAWHYAALQSTALWRYLFMIVVPVGQSIDHDFDIVPFWVQVLALGLTAWWIVFLMAMWVGKFRAIWVFGLTWMVIALTPRFLMRIPEYLNEHQLMMSMCGISLAAASILMGDPANHRVGRSLTTKERDSYGVRTQGIPEVSPPLLEGVCARAGSEGRAGQDTGQRRLVRSEA